MNFIIALLLVEYAHAEPVCATADELANGADTIYHLRFLIEEDFNKLGNENAFATSGIETGNYIGYNETTAMSANLNIATEFGEASKFIIEKNTGKGFKVVSTDTKLPKDDQMNQRRFLSWNQSKISNGGYFMYTASKIVDNLPYYTQFVYDDATNSFFAMPDGTNSKYPLGIYAHEKSTAIHQENNGGAKNTKFCFQKVDAPFKCLANGGKSEDLNAEFTSTECQTDFVEANTVCTAKCVDSHVANGPATVDYTCGSDGKWKFEKDIKCAIAPPCATVRELKQADEGTSYYLRFLSKEDFNKDKKNIFKSAGPESGKYIGYQETKATSAYLKIATDIGEASKFSVQVDEDEEGLRVYSRQKNNEKRILSWSQSNGKGYFMYKSSKSTEKADNSDANTRFNYDAFYSFSARPYNTDDEYPLAVYDHKNSTAIYRQQDLSSEHSETKFCFERVDTSTKSPSGSETDNKEQNKETEKEEKVESILLREEGKYIATYRELSIQQRKDAKSAIMKILDDVDLDQIKKETIEEALETFFNSEMKSHLKHFLEKSEKDDAKQYRAENPETQEKIQKYIAKSLENKTGFEITEKDVVDAIADYYSVNVPHQKGSSAISFGALGAAVMCMLLLN